MFITKFSDKKNYLCHLNSLSLRYFLFIDNGNTAIKGLLTDTSFRPVHSFSVLPGQFAEETAKLLSYGGIAGGLYASVGALPDALRTVFEDTFRLRPFSPAVSVPLSMGYHTPETLGPDRLATAVGAYSLYPGTDVLVLDFGTCLKFDFVTRTGSYEGGSISPGLQMRFKAMHTFTAKLPLLTVPEKFPADPIGRSTHTSMQNGVMFGMLAEAEGMIDLYRREHPGVNVLVTGGDAEVFEGRLKNAIFVHQNLALLGLAETMKSHANTPNE